MAPMALPQKHAEDNPQLKQGHQQQPPDQPGGQQRLLGGRGRLTISPVAWAQKASG